MPSTISTLSALLDALDTASSDERLGLYAEVDVVVTADELPREGDDRPCAAWLALRVEAGPPGRSLPEVKGASARLFTTDATLADAAAVWLRPRATPEDEATMSHHLGRYLELALHHGAERSVGVLVREFSLLGARSGAPTSAQARLDELQLALRRPGEHASARELLGPLADDAMLRESPWVRVAAAAAWSRMELPAARTCEPRTAVLLQTALETDPGPTLARLQALGHPLGPVLDHLLHDLLDAHVRVALADDPTVLTIVRAARTGAARLDPALAVPAELFVWARSMLRAGDFQAARLAAWLLHDVGRLPPEALVPFLLVASRRTDLALLAEHAPVAEFRDLCRDYDESLRELPDDLADALVAICFRYVAPGALATCSRHRDKLTAASPAMRPHMREEVDALLRTLQTIADDRAAAEPTWRRIVARARCIGAESSTHSDFGARVAAEARELLSLGVLELAAERIAELAPRDAMWTALLLLAWLPGDDHAGIYQRIFAERAFHAILAAEEATMLPRAATLVEWLIEHGGARHTLPELIYYRARVTPPEVLQRPEERARAMRGLRLAIDLARRSGAGWCEVKATCQWVTLHLLQLPAGPPRALALADAKAILDAAESAATAWEMLPELWSARARVLLLGGDPDAAADAWRHALRHAEPDRHPIFRADLLGNLAQMLTLSRRSDRLEEAESLAREALRILPAESGPSSTAFTRGVLGFVLAHRDSDSLGDAIVLLEDALRAPWRQLGLAHPSTLRLALVHAYRRTGRISEARHHLNVVVVDPDVLDDVELALDAVVRARELDDVDDQDTAWSLVARLLRRHIESPWRPTLELLRAIASDLSVAVPLACSYIAGELPRHPLVDELLRRAIDRQVESLPHPLLEQYLESGGLGPDNLHVRGKIFLALGRKDVLRVELESRLAGPQPAHERATSLAFLLEVLPRAALRRQAAIDELDVLLRSTELPHLRAHLAAVMFRLHRENPSYLRRAAEHAEAAPCDDPEIAGDVWRLRAGIRGAQMSALLESSPRSVEIARWFAQELPLAAPEVAEMRLAMVRQLLFPAALAHPEVLDLAHEFIVRLNGEEAEDLSRRLVWIRRQREAPDGIGPVVTARTRGVATHFDNAPAWLIDLVAGRLPSSPAALSREDARWLLEAASIRPDRAGELLIWLVEHAAAVLPELIHEIASVPVRGSRESIGQRLRELVGTLLEQRPDFSLRKLEVLFFQSALEWGDGTAYERSADALLAAAATPEQRAEAHFFKGVERLHACQKVPTKSHAQLRAAREHLGEAATLAVAHPLPSHLHFGILISSGNAYRHGEDRDLERALEFYAQAEALGAPNKDEVARLCKVRADALVARRLGTDVLDALALLDRALRIRRSGWLRAETLLSAHDAELARDELPPADRLRRGLDRLAEAAEHDDGSLAEPLIELQLRSLDQLLDAVPGDRTAHQRLDEIAAKHPAKAGIVQLVHLRHRFPAGVQRDHRDVLDLVENTLGIVAHVEEKAVQRGSNKPSPVTWARERLQRLTPEAAASAGPGMLAARALLCAFLCGETGEIDPTTAKAAVEAALGAVAALTERPVQAMLLGELSRIFAPDDHQSHPLRDFRRAAELCERALALGDLPEMITVDLLGYLARATRYRTDGDVRGHLLRAEELYERVVSMRRRSGRLAEAQHTAANLAELRAALERGGAVSARRSEIAALREAVAAVGAGGLPIDRAALARELTLLGSDTPGDEGTAMLSEGAEHFAALPWERMDRNLVDSAENYRTICLAELAVRRGDAGAAGALWRARLARFDRECEPKAWAMAAHNLADLLLRVGSPTEVREALELCVLALALRRLDQDLLHHWETAFQLGQTALALLGDPIFRRASRQVFELAVEAVHSALVAATKLGGGERQFRTGITLLRFGLHAPATARLEALVDEAWTHINVGRTALLGHASSAATESAAALAVSEALADRLGEQALIGVTAGCAYVLSAEAAARVLPWMVRAAGAGQRRLAARTRRPEGVPHATWVRWLAALRGGDDGEIARELEKVQVCAPNFCSGEPELHGLEAWLRARPDAAAILLLPGRAGLLAAVVDWQGGLRIRVARLTAPPPPCDEAQLARSIRVTEYSEPYMRVGRWADEHVVAPLLGLVPDGLRHLLWLPSGPLRMLSPAHLWPGVAVSLAADMCLRSWPPMQSSRVAMIVADPGSRGREIPGVLRLTETLATVAESIGSIRVRLSCGERWGDKLGCSIRGLVDGPADANGLLGEIAESEVVLLMCHGFADGPDDAEIEVVNADGRSERLTIQQIAADPRRIAGQTFVLLSCETGRAGAWLHQAGGIAGALLACGARQVLAPLWPVLVDVAVDVGAAALRALATGKDLGELLTALHDPTLPIEDQISRAGFVLWTA